MLIFVLLGVEVVLLIVSYNMFGRDLLRPSVILMLMFSFSTMIASLNIVEWHINYSPYALFILTVGFLTAIFVDYIFFSKSVNVASEVQKVQPIVIEKWKIFLSTGFGIISLFVYYKEILRLAILSGYVEGANLLWHFRNITSYQAEESIRFTVGLLIRGIDAIGYVMTFIVINNLISKKMKLRNLIIYFFPIAVFIIRVLMGSGRQELLRLTGFAFVVSYILNMYKTGWTSSISKKYISKALIIVPIALILFFNASSLIGRSTTRTFGQYISTYSGGSIQHFNQYVQDPVSAEHFGEESFPGVYSFLHRLGITDYTRPVHLEMRVLGITKGNVYTFFRRPYADFGLAGMIVFTALVFSLFSSSYSKFKLVRLSKKNNIGIIYYSYLVYWILLSSIEQYSIGIVSLGTLMTLILMHMAYYFFAFIRWK